MNISDFFLKQVSFLLRYFFLTLSGFQVGHAEYFEFTVMVFVVLSFGPIHLGYLIQVIFIELQNLEVVKMCS